MTTLMFGAWVSAACMVGCLMMYFVQKARSKFNHAPAFVLQFLGRLLSLLFGVSTGLRR
jgi:hypothetical protein